MVKILELIEAITGVVLRIRDLLDLEYKKALLSTKSLDQEVARFNEQAVAAATDPGAEEKEEPKTEEPTLDREALKARLREMKVPFATSCKTTTLVRKLKAALAEAKAAIDGLAEEENSSSYDKAVVTKNQARDALVEVTRRVGKDKAFEIMQGVAGATQLRNINSNKYPDILVAAREVLAHAPK